MSQSSQHKPSEEPRGGFDPERMVGANSVPEHLNELSRRVIGAAIEAHRNLCPGLRESAYERAFLAELKLAGLHAERQVAFRVQYKGEDLGLQVIDLIVEQQIIVECKSIELVTDRDLAQLLGYLRFTGLPIGLLINFNVAILKHGISRRINYPPRTLGAMVTMVRDRSVLSVRPS